MYFPSYSANRIRSAESNQSLPVYSGVAKDRETLPSPLYEGLYVFLIDIYQTHNAKFFTKCYGSLLT